MELIIQIISSSLLTNILLLIIIAIVFVHNSSVINSISNQSKIIQESHFLLYTISLQHASESNEKNDILVRYEDDIKKEALKKKMFNIK